LAKKTNLPDWAVPPLNPIRVGHKKAEHRKILMPGLDTGTYDFQSPSVQPDMVLAVPSLDDLMKKYLTNPLAHKAINLRANRIIGNGYILKSAESAGLNPLTAEKAVKDCEMFQERINYINFFRGSIINAYVAGNEWTELIYPDEELLKLAKAPRSVLNLNHGDFKTLDFRRNYINNRIIFDGQGEPAGYQQYIPDLSVFHHTVAHLGGIVSAFDNLQAGKERLQKTQTLEIKNANGDVIGRVLAKPQYIFLQKDEIVHLAFNTINDNFWGMSFLIPAYNSLVQLEIVMNATSETINDMGYPKLDVTVGSVLSDGTVRYAGETELDAAQNMIQDPVRREGYAHGADWTIKYLQPNIGPGTNINDYPQAYITLAAIGLKTPRELLTGEGESNRATANQNGTDYEKDCAADQRIFEEYAKKILGYFLKSRGYATDSDGNCIYTPNIVWPVMVSEETALKQRLVIEKWQNGAIDYNTFLKELDEPEIEDRERGDKYYDELHISAPAPMMDTLTASQGKTMAAHSLPSASEMEVLNEKFHTENVNYKKVVQDNVGTEIVSTSKKDAVKIRDEITKEAMQPTVNLEKMKKKIEKIGDLEPFEAKRIVRTELSNLSNAARLENAKNKGLTFKVWQAVIDDKTSELSKALDGQVKKINEDFEADYSENGKVQHWKGLAPPENPNSRCKVVYYGTDPSEFKAFTQNELVKISESSGDLNPNLVLVPSNRPELDKLTITLAERTGIPSNKLASHMFELLLLGFGAGALSVLPVKLPFKENEKRFYSKLGESIKNKPNRQMELKLWLNKNVKADAKDEILKLLGGKS
jgi:SPP1 gp7 family putative phage head morphogenesis protein